MHPILQQNQFFVKEQVGMFKAANSYDIIDPATQQEIMHCREPNLGAFTKLLRFTKYKTMTPFEVVVHTPAGEPVLTVKRGVNIFLSKVQVLDEHGQPLGSFKQKLFSIGGAFDVLDVNEQVVCTLKGKWTSWDFRFLQGEVELATVSKKWAGHGKELFTSADNSMLAINTNVAQDEEHRILIFAAVMCIDMVMKE
jgi:uncharacterized protein YxjI